MLYKNVLKFLWLYRNVHTSKYTTLCSTSLVKYHTNSKLGSHIWHNTNVNNINANNTNVNKINVNNDKYQQFGCTFRCIKTSVRFPCDHSKCLPGARMTIQYSWVNQ